MSLANVSLERRFKTSFLIGRIVEDIFERVATLNGYKVKRASREEDIKNRIDFYLYPPTTKGKKPLLVDVKGRRKKRRWERGGWALAVEIINSRGDYVFEKPFTHYAFEINVCEFLLVKKEIVYDFVERLARQHKAKIRDYPEFYSFYRRREAIVFLAPEEELRNIYHMGEIIYYPYLKNKILAELAKKEMRLRQV